MRLFHYVIHWKEGGSVSGIAHGSSEKQVEAYLRGANAHRAIASIEIWE